LKTATKQPLRGRKEILSGEDDNATTQKRIGIKEQVRTIEKVPKRNVSRAKSEGSSLPLLVRGRIVGE